MSLLAARQALLARVLSFVDGSLHGAPTESFEAIALALHRFQVAHDPVQRALAEGVEVRDWTEIPAVPVALFKDLPIGTVSEDEAAAVFRTSGTTGSGRGAHCMRDTVAYDRGALGWHAHMVPGAPRRVVALLQDPTHTPDSSLSHMVAGFGEVRWFLGDEGLDVDGALAAIREGGPVYLCATAFALAELLDGPVAPLPPGSVVMVTGGFKGRRLELSDAELYGTLARLMAPERVFREYGMTELSSQLWADGGAPYRPPPWLRVLAVDPATGRPRGVGEAGQLRFVDLCNLDGAVAIETLDEGVVHADGSLTLLGRLAGAEVRGCSLTVEELQEHRERS